MTIPNTVIGRVSRPAPTSLCQSNPLQPRVNPVLLVCSGGLRVHQKKIPSLYRGCRTSFSQARETHHSASRGDGFHTSSGTMSSHFNERVWLDVRVPLLLDLSVPCSARKPTSTLTLPTEHFVSLCAEPNTSIHEIIGCHLVPSQKQTDIIF